MRTKLTGLLAAAALAAAFTMAGSIPAAAAASYTCSGGSFASPSVIPAGTYSSIDVTGFCSPGAGTVIVRHGLTVAPGAGFASQGASSTVTIGGGVDVETGGMLALGCGPSFDTPCPEGPTAVSTDSIGGNVRADGAALLIVHYDTIGGNVRVRGGGGGLTCANLPGLPTPPYLDFANNSIGGNAAVTGISTCWAGFSNNTLGGNVEYTNNQTGLPDGNFVGGNTIARNLRCAGDSPTPHLSDAGGGVPVVPNSVLGHTSGQCVGEII